MTDCSASSSRVDTASTSAGGRTVGAERYPPLPLGLQLFNTHLNFFHRSSTPVPIQPPLSPLTNVDAPSDAEELAPSLPADGKIDKGKKKKAGVRSSKAVIKDDDDDA